MIAMLAVLCIVGYFVILFQYYTCLTVWLAKNEWCWKPRVKHDNWKVKSGKVVRYTSLHWLWLGIFLDNE